MLTQTDLPACEVTPPPRLRRIDPAIRHSKNEFSLPSHRPELEADPFEGGAFFTYLSNQRSIS